jgi:hypothetical protein
MRRRLISFLRGWIRGSSRLDIEFGGRVGLVMAWDIKVEIGAIYLDWIAMARNWYGVLGARIPR